MKIGEQGPVFLPRRTEAPRAGPAASYSREENPKEPQLTLLNTNFHGLPGLAIQLLLIFNNEVSPFRDRLNFMQDPQVYSGILSWFSSPEIADFRSGLTLFSSSFILVCP